MTAHRPDLSDAVWRKSSYSSSTGQNCVEVAAMPDIVAVRDSQDAQGSELLISRADWQSFVGRMKTRLSA